MAPPWSSRLLSKKCSRSKESSSAVDVHAWSTGRNNAAEDGTTREKTRWRQGWAWRFRRLRRRPRCPLPPSHLHDDNNNNSISAFALALVFFSLGVLLVAGTASSYLRSKITATSVSSSSSSSFSRLLSLSLSSSGVVTSYAPPKNWTSPPDAVRVVDGDTIVAAGIVVRLLGMDAPEDGQLCSSRRRRRKKKRWGVQRREKEKRETSSSSFFSQWWRLLLSPLMSKKKAKPQAPSRSYDCGAEATRVLRGLVSGKSLRCERKGTDKYGRALSRCFVDRRKSLFSWLPPLRDNNKSSKSIDIGEWMLREGHAVSYLGFTKLYLEAEKEAKEMQKGIWGGEVEVPKVWREKKRMEREAKAKRRNAALATAATKKKATKASSGRNNKRSKNK